MGEEVSVWECNIGGIKVNPDEYVTHTLIKDVTKLKWHTKSSEVFKVEILFKSGQVQKWYFNDIKQANDMYNTLHKQLNEYLRKRRNERFSENGV